MKNKRIIIIDNDFLAGSSLSSRLNAFGVQARTIDVSGDIDAILKELWLDKPDYIFISLNSNKNDQRDILYHIKSDDELCAVPVFAYSENEQDISGHPAIERHIKHNNNDPEEFSLHLSRIIRVRETASA